MPCGGGSCRRAELGVWAVWEVRRGCSLWPHWGAGQPLYRQPREGGGGCEKSFLALKERVAEQGGAAPEAWYKTQAQGRQGRARAP